MEGRGLLQSVLHSVGHASAHGAAGVDLVDRRIVQLPQCREEAGAEGLDIVEAYACEPMMSSVAHSVCLIKMAEGSDIEAAKTAIRENVNPRKWICVSVEPENIRVESIGNLILLVMDNNHCQQITDNFLELAK